VQGRKDPACRQGCRLAGSLGGRRLSLIASSDRRAAHVASILSIQHRQNAGGVARKKVEAYLLEKEQMAHSTYNVDPLIDGRLTVRLMRRVDWTC
jgi:hypothetical protein